MDPTAIAALLIQLAAALTGAEPETITTAIHTGTTLVAAASAVAALTPTPADDRWLGKAYRVVDFFALNLGKAKDRPAANLPSPRVPGGDGRH